MVFVMDFFLKEKSWYDENVGQLQAKILINELSRQVALTISLSQLGNGLLLEVCELRLTVVKLKLRKDKKEGENMLGCSST